MAPPHRPALTRKTFAEFFAGIGLVHLGLQPSGWSCVYANDIDPKKARMYSDQFGPAPYYHIEDVWNKAAVLDRLTQRAFLATASFPCIDLSLAGKWQGLGGLHSSTYFGFLNILESLGDQRPAMVMIENVCGFLTSNHGRDFDEALLRLARLGYFVDAIVLDARWFVPQSRPRLFIFGFHESLRSDRLVRRDDAFALDHPWRDAVDRSATLRPAGLRSVSERLELPTGWATVPFDPPERATHALAEMIDLDDEQAWWNEEDTSRHYDMMEPPSRQRVDALRAAGGVALGTAFRRTRRGRTRLEVRFDMAGCLRTPKGGSAKQIVLAIVNGSIQMRWMSPREYARLQGAAGFTIDVPPIQAMYGFGDAVCVPAIEWIDRTILTPVFDSAQAEALATAVRDA